MKRTFTLLVILVFSYSANAQDLPPATPDIQTLGIGSYVIPMDEEKQSTLQIEPGTGVAFTGFNTKSYGLVHALLEAGIPLKWVIKTGKVKDEADFSAFVTKIHPSQGPFQTEEFIAGAFVIDAQEVITDSCAVGSGSFSLTDQVISEFGNGISVYRLEAETDVDVRYSMNYAPRIAIIDDGVFPEAHYKLLDNAQIPYTLIESDDFFQDFSCYTTITQPHLEPPASANYFLSLNEFLQNGGNFIAQCSSIETFENGGNFMTTNGVSSGFMACENTQYSYFNPDMPIMQFEGELPLGIFGTISSFFLDANSSFLSTSYLGVINELDRFVVTAADVNGAIPGGNIFYLGGHEYSSDFIGVCTGSPNPEKLNQAVRLFLNTLFVPTTIRAACAGSDFCIMPGQSVDLGCGDFSNQPGINYTWEPAEGLSCTDCPFPIASPDTTTTYSLTVTSDLGNLCTKPSRVTVMVMEITSVDRFEISGVEVLVYPNPASSYIQLDIKSERMLEVDVNVQSTLGETFFVKEDHILLSGMENLIIPISDWPTGMYFINLAFGNSMLTKKIVVAR